MSQPTRRRWPVRLAVATAGIAAVVAIGVWRLTVPPSELPDYTEVREAPSGQDGVSVTRSITIAAPRAEVIRWNSDPDMTLEDLIEPVEGVPQVVGTDELIGDWDPSADRTGARRRVRFADGHTLAEEVLVDSDGTFGYMIWGFTDHRRLAVREGAAQFDFVEDGDVTHVSWTYTLWPTTALVRPVLRGFLDGSMAAMMEGTLSAMRDGVEAAAP